MKKILASAVALTLATGIGGAAAGVAAQGPFYQAKIAAADVPASKFVVRDVVFSCSEDGACQSVGKSASRPQIVCQSLVKKVGAVSAFRAGGETMDATALETCNAKAK